MKRFALLALAVGALLVGAPTAWAATGYDTIVATDGASSEWTLAEPSGTSFADLIGSNTGTGTGSIAYSQSTGHAGLPDGIALGGTTSDYIGFGDVLDRTGDFTYEAWIETGSFPSIQTILSKGSAGGVDGFSFRLDTSGHLQYVLNWGGTLLGTSSGSVAASTWEYVALTHSGTLYTFYIDGAAAGSFTTSSHAGDTTDPLRIGVNTVNGGRSEACTCSFAAVADYPTGLTGTEIADHYAARDDATTTGGGGTTGGGLSADDSTRLDLIWLGMWALVGLSLFGCVAFTVRSVFT